MHTTPVPITPPSFPIARFPITYVNANQLKEGYCRGKLSARPACVSSLLSASRCTLIDREWIYIIPSIHGLRHVNLIPECVGVASNGALGHVSSNLFFMLHFVAKKYEGNLSCQMC